MPDSDEVVAEFLAFGLRSCQSRLLAVLVNLGSANALTLAEASGVPRTNIYRVMKDLANLGLAEQIPTVGSSVWACAGWEHVLDTMEARLLEELQTRQARLRRLRDTSSQTFNTPGSRCV